MKNLHQSFSLMSVIDVIGVIRNNTIKCSPFCVNFSKKPKIDTKVKIFINDIELGMTMILDKSGNTTFPTEYLNIDTPTKKVSTTWKEKTMDMIVTVPPYELLVPDESIIGKFFLDNKITKEINTIKFKHDDEEIESNFFLWGPNEKIVIVDIGLKNQLNYRWNNYKVRCKRTDYDKARI